MTSLVEKTDGQLNGVLDAHATLGSPRLKGGEDSAVNVQTIDDDKPLAHGGV
jgi:hypothetical protein